MTISKRRETPSLARQQALAVEKWLAQFQPVPEAEITPRQRQFLESLRRPYPSIAVGRKDGSLFVYAYGSVGPFKGLLPVE